MNETGIGVGLAALGFWLFMAVAIIGGVWGMVRRREIQLELVRLVLESGQKIDQAILDRIFPPRVFARNAGFILIILGICIASLGLYSGVNYFAALALGAFSFLSGAYFWIKAGK